ncbi:MAG: SH3 domain-containing protein [Eubacteriales bacterium]|nr:SH3 domain-containing protein [Eubacteriales bacterium]
MNKTMKAAHDVYVRKGPKKEFEKLGAYAKGAEVKVTGQVYKHGNKACWVQVSYKGETGYVCTDYLK